MIMIHHQSGRLDLMRKLVYKFNAPYKFVRMSRSGRGEEIAIC